MNYSAHYEKLIARARHRVLAGYKERHHVLPRCMDGTDAADNLVDLTAEEHYLCHQLLVKMYPENRKLVHAANLMAKRSGGNKVYGWLRRRQAEDISYLNRGNNHRLGYKFSAESRAKMSESAKRRMSKQHYQKMLAGLRTPQCRKKISEARLGKKQKPETIEKRRASRDGYRHSQETREKIGASNKGRKPATCRPVIHTGYGIFFDSASEAADVLGISKGFLYNMLTGRRKNKTFLRFA